MGQGKLSENALGIHLHLRGRNGAFKHQNINTMSDPIVQSHYSTSGVNHSSSTAAGQAEARLGVQPAGQQPNETFSDYCNRQAAHKSASQSSGS
jgi:hypothetical protein